MPILSFGRQQGTSFFKPKTQPRKEVNPHTLSSYDFIFKHEPNAWLLPPDSRPTSEILASRSQLKQKLNIYLDAVDELRGQVAINHAAYAQRVGNLDLAQPRKKMGVDPGRDEAVGKPDHNNIPEFWPTLKSGAAYDIDIIPHALPDLGHVNMPKKEFRESFGNQGNVEQSIFTLNIPGKRMSKSDRREFIAQRDLFMSDLRQAMAHTMNLSWADARAYVFVDYERVSKYSYEEKIRFHFPETDAERHLWRETFMGIPRPVDPLMSGMNALSLSSNHESDMSTGQARGPKQPPLPFSG